jgi:hypothetical protein
MNPSALDFFDFEQKRKPISLPIANPCITVFEKHMEPFATETGT